MIPLIILAVVYSACGIPAFCIAMDEYTMNNKQFVFTLILSGPIVWVAYAICKSYDAVMDYLEDDECSGE